MRSAIYLKNWRVKRVFLDLVDNMGERIAGIDEAGRGPLAGPVVVAAVIMPKDGVIEGVDDSKKLTPKKREELFGLITERAVGYGIAEIDNRVIDEINILEATKRGVFECVKKLSPRPDFIYIDGNMKFDLDIPYKSVVSGDSLVYCCACASILAKVTRDRIMCGLPERYALYKFDRHKGYGTELHYEMLRLYGASDLHRRTFLREK
jgi:ribonuclease HII